MPFLFLSPSTQEFNPYITEGNEEYWMNLLADRMEPYLHASGVNTVRNDPAAGAAGAIRLSNQGDYDFHLALHSNASPEALAGQQRGVDFYYYPASTAGLRMANILVDNIKTIYPLPERVQARPTTAIGEVRRTKAPSVLAELGYHDNTDDAAWLTGNLDEIAQALSLGVTEYFGLPFLIPGQLRDAVVRTDGDSLNLRALPSAAGPVLSMTRGTRSSMTGSTASRRVGTSQNNRLFQPSFPSRRVSMSPSAQPRSFPQTGQTRKASFASSTNPQLRHRQTIGRSLRYSRSVCIWL